MKIVAIIPARKGSKGIKNKNIISYKNKPLIYHSIKSALKLKKLIKFLCQQIPKFKNIAEKYGATVILRPKN